MVDEVEIGAGVPSDEHGIGKGTECETYSRRVATLKLSKDLDAKSGQFLEANYARGLHGKCQMRSQGRVLFLNRRSPAAISFAQCSG
jgi:hypothetical protein